ncbi:MAG: hypothetical protein KQJ78_14195 [Deltaproteobacteria bacterium]|nr:hypothetical protein [Deltaproteobacteria bacterium]
MLVHLLRFLVQMAALILGMLAAMLLGRVMGELDWDRDFVVPVVVLIGIAGAGAAAWTLLRLTKARKSTWRLYGKLKAHALVAALGEAVWFLILFLTEATPHDPFFFVFFLAVTLLAAIVLQLVDRVALTGA